MKKCLTCKRILDESKFSKCHTWKDGLSQVCKECDKIRLKKQYRKNPEYYKEKARENRKKTIDYLLKIKSNPCTDCGKVYPPCCMDFDHINDDKFGNISTLKGRSIYGINKEILKCELVCSNCHRIRTFKRSLGLNINDKS